jgi:hypothetical protein
MIEKGVGHLIERVEERVGGGAAGRNFMGVWSILSEKEKEEGNG